MPTGGRLIPPALLFAMPTVEVESGTGVEGAVVGSNVVVEGSAADVVVRGSVADVVVRGSVADVVEGAFGALEEVTRSRLGFFVGLKSGVVASSSNSCDSSDSTDSRDSTNSCDSSDSINSCDSSDSTNS